MYFHIGAVVRILTNLRPKKVRKRKIGGLENTVKLSQKDKKKLEYNLGWFGFLVPGNIDVSPGLKRS